MEQETIKLEEIASKHLGQSGSYAIQTDKFDSSLLVPMPRYNGRKDWGIENEKYTGVDVWHCHEATFLLENGLPIAGTLKIIYDASSEFMVESKSIKLYLNSFDMCKMGKTFSEAIFNYETQVKTDLANLLQCDVMVQFHQEGSEQFGKSPVEEYESLYDLIGEETLESIQITDYNVQESHLKFEPLDGKRYYKLSFNALRSRCRHTKQKDSGSAYLYLALDGQTLDLVSLVKHLTSLREANEFHELLADKLISDLKKFPFVLQATVTLLYSRRGSLDINPIRTTHKELIPKVMTDVSIYTEKAMNQ